MKILFVTDLYPVKNGEYTTPLTLHNFVCEWIKLGISVDVVKPNFLFNSVVRNKPLYKTGLYDYDGVNVYNINYFLPFMFNIENKLPLEINIKEYDLIVAHMPSGIIWANKIAQKYNKPLVCGVHISDITVLTKTLYKKYFSNCMKDAYKYAKKIACRSSVLQNKICEIIPEAAQKTFVAPSGIHPEYITKREIDFHSPIKVLTCAQLIKRKNIDKVILALKDMPEFELKVIGDGKEKRNLKHIAGKNVKFSGKIERVKVLNEMRNSDIFILPSVDETFGMVYIEAMASGCVTVGTQNDGIDGIIKDGQNGFLCKPTIENIKEILLKIKEENEKGVKQASFFGAPTLRRIVENAEDTVKNYTLEKCAQNYIKNIFN